MRFLLFLLLLGLPPVRHEPLPPLRPGAAGQNLQNLVPDADPKALAAAIRAGTAFIPRPEASQPGDLTPVYGPRQAPRVGLDRRTQADGKLHYQSVFDPEVVPFKRELAYDTVHGDVTLAQSGQGLQALPPTPLPAEPGRELFWGHLRLQLPAGQQVPLPSIAPDSRLLQWQSTPHKPLEFQRDRAGNFYVTAPQTADVDLRFVMDAPSTYFAAPLGTHQAHHDPEKPLLDAQLQTRAEALWPAMGLNRAQNRREQLLKLAEWFRSFVPGEPPQASADPLADLVLAKKGVCRHRALGLVIMAHSLGIPAHYVMNDAHAFVEIWSPLQDGTDAWQRLDLGGGAESLDVHAAQNKRMHVPQGRDPFPRPAGYGDDTTDIRVDGQPLKTTGNSLAGARKVNGLGQMQGVTQGTAEGGQPAGNSLPHPANSMEETRRAWLRQHAQTFAAPLEVPRPGQTPPEAQENRQPTRMTLRQAAPLAWIGEALELSGQLTTQPLGKLEHLQVEIWLIDPRKPLKGQLLGVAVTTADGQWKARVAMPLETELTTYDVVARFAGNPLLQPCDSAQ